MTWLRRTFILTLLLVGGCGYQPMYHSGPFPGGAQSMYIALFGNRTTEAFLENTVTDTVIDRFSRRRGLQLVEAPERADALLSGALVGYSVAATAYNSSDQITQYRVNLAVEAELRRRLDGKILWKGTVGWGEEFPNNADLAIQEDNEAAARLLAADRLAEELYYRVLDAF